MENLNQPLLSASPVFTQTPVEPEQVKKSFPWLIATVIVFLLAGSSILAYKYYQLKQQVTQTQPSPSPAETPVPSAALKEGQFCGGFAGAVCPEGYTCKYDGNYPDAGGVCTKN